MTTKHRRILTLFACLALGALQGGLASAEPTAKGPPRERGRSRRGVPNGKNDVAVRSAFQAALERASAATVRILADGQEVALGAVVEPDGYLVSKASVLSGKITCRFKDGTEKEALLVGADGNHDLALLLVEATNLTALVWQEGTPPPPGSLVATTAPANQPLAIGVVSTDLRRVLGPAEPTPPRGWLGIELGPGRSGLVVGAVLPNSPAAKAGVHVGDEIRQIEGTLMGSTDQIVQTVGRHASGQTIKLLVQRDNESVELLATLAQPRTPPAPQDEWGGGPFSGRRSGFPVVLPHDTPLHPKDCGGPLVDTDGRAVGINIARALRVTTYALPASVVRQTVSELKQKSQRGRRD
jgi:serine protease Do